MTSPTHCEKVPALEDRDASDGRQVESGHVWARVEDRKEGGDW